MMRVFISSLVLVMIAGLAFSSRYIRKQETTQMFHIEKPKTLAEEETEIITFALTAMEMAPIAKMSEARKTVLAEKIAKVTIKYLTTQIAREQFVAMIKNETNFNHSLVSLVGAVGIAQVMRPTFKETMVKLNMGITADDIANEEINLMVGAYYYNEMIIQQKGNPRLATIAYNGGKTTADKFKKMSAINAESANYALKTDHVRETVKATIEASEVQ
jgi:soluble lytic murein transglycosylase-like protein